MAWSREKMIATKSAHVVVHMAKMVTYAAFGAMTMPYLGYGWLLVYSCPSQLVRAAGSEKLAMNSFDSS